MNPEDNNINGSGDSFGMGPIDFTSNSDGLSMSDSLASAQDNLTSAGMAAGIGNGSDAMSLDQIGASDSSAYMARPNEPLIPAAPVPGSIGSVISGPALSDTSNMNVTDDSGFVNPAAAAAPASADSASASGGGFAPIGTPAPAPSAMPMSGMSASSAAPISTNMPQFQAAPSSQVGNTPSAQSQPSAPYNPFSTTSASPAQSAPVSNTPGIPFVAPKTPEIAVGNIPTPNNNQTPKVNLDAKQPRKSSSNLLTIILGILAVAMLALAIVFAVLWFGTQNKKDTVYEAPPVADGGQQDAKNIAVTCTREKADPIDGLNGFVNLRTTVSLNFTNDVLQNVSVLDSYSFADGDSASAADAYFQTLGATFADYAAQSGVKDLGIKYSVTGNVVDWTATATPEQLVDVNLSAFQMPTDDAGAVLKDRNLITERYTQMGYTCNQFEN